MADVAEPGDYLIVSTRDVLSESAAVQLKDRLKALLPQLADVIVAAGITEITVVKGGAKNG